MSQEFPPLREKVVQVSLREPCVEFIGFRASKRMAVCLKANALMEGCEISSLVRALLDEALEARGLGQSL